MDELVKYLKALVYLQAQQHVPDESGVKTEVLLARAGFAYKEIADILGKTEPAIAKSVNRAKHSGKKGSKDD